MGYVLLHKLQGKQYCPKPKLRTYKVFFTQNRLSVHKYETLRPWEEGLFTAKYAELCSLKSFYNKLNWRKRPHSIFVGF